MADYPPPPPGDANWGPPPGQPAGFPPPGSPYGGAPGYGGRPDYGGASFASWGQRLGAYLLDSLIGIGLFLVAGLVGGLFAGLISAASGDVAAVSLIIPYAAGIGFQIWNLVRQGQTGQTVGKGVMNIRLVRLDNGAPVGAWLSIGRSFVHVLDALPCYLGFFWPLWDAKRQTFADKILQTVVIEP